jgi:hypothetical protein
MTDSATIIIRRIPNTGREQAFAGRLLRWLVEDLNRVDAGQIAAGTPSFTESRARALLRAAEALDDPTLHDFQRLMEVPDAQRVALYDLLDDSQLAENGEIGGLIALSAGDEPAPIGWLSLAVAVYAWKSGYLLHQLDPASPPAPYSPAGQVLKRAAHFVRRQVQRSPTERDKLLRPLNLPSTETPSLDELAASGTIPPLPPHFRPPVPERYPEIARETVRVDPDDAVPPAVTTGQPLVITDEDLEPAPIRPAAAPPADEPVRMSPITLNREQVTPATPEPRRPPSPLPPSGVVMPASNQSRPAFAVALRQRFGQEELTTTKLRILVQEYPDGPGLYGLQVRVTCQGIKSYVAGTTDREGRFVCELPVRLQAGLTYDVDVTWPRDMGGDIERKSITLNADRTEFVLPFYHQLNQPG